MVKVIFDITDEMNSQLQNVMSVRGLRRASLCRYAISKFLENEQKQTTNPSA